MYVDNINKNHEKKNLEVSSACMEAHRRVNDNHWLHACMKMWKTHFEDVESLVLDGLALVLQCSEWTGNRREKSTDVLRRIQIGNNRDKNKDMIRRIQIGNNRDKNTDVLRRLQIGNRRKKNEDKLRFLPMSQNEKSIVIHRKTHSETDDWHNESRSLGVQQVYALAFTGE